MGQSKDTIQSTLQVDLDLSKVKAQAQEADRLEAQAQRKADEIRQKARETVEELEADERRVEAAVHKFKHKAFQHPAKNLFKAGVGMLAADIVSGFEGGEGATGFVSKAASSALLALPAGPEAAAFAALASTVESLIELAKDSQKESVEVKKRIVEAAERQQLALIELTEKIDQIERQRRIDEEDFRLQVEAGARKLDYDTWALMGPGGD